jgi:hypothetical protein
MLASHPQMTSFSESHFFSNGFRHFRTDNLIYWPCAATRENLKVFLKDNDFDLETQVGFNQKNTIFFRANQWSRLFISYLDNYTESIGKSGWIEKTPKHLHHIRYIQKNFPDAQFIHILRDGRDAVASIYDVANSHTEIWSARTLEGCVEEWNQDMAIGVKWVKKDPKRHFGIRYEELVEAPEVVLKKVCKFLGLEWNFGMLEYQKVAAEVIKPFEVWKTGNLRKLQQTTRYDKLTDEQKKTVEKSLNNDLASQFPHIMNQ